MRRILLGTVATLALLGTGLSWPAGSSLAADSPGPGAREAGSTSAVTSSARVAKGTKLSRDLNTLTRRQAAAVEARQQKILKASGISVQPRPNGSVSIPIDFHGITDRQGHGFVSLERIYDQIKVLNQAFGGRTGAHAANTPFRFYLNSVSRTKSDRWYNANAFTNEGLAKLREMRRALHVGNAKHLNMYTVGPKFRLLGFATLPSGRNARLDGTVLFNASLPGGNANYGPGSVYNQGDTATHEIGHWLNVYHTFQGGCGQRNDYVTDTPRQKAASNVFEEDTSLNTCGTATSPKDPVRNFMNYTDDPFMNQFTRGQRDRMNSAWYIRQVLAAND